MKAIYSAKVPSTEGRRNKRTGRVEEYLVVIFDTGEAQCTCYAYMFHTNKTPEDKYRYRCKHLEKAFREQGIDDQGWVSLAKLEASLEKPPAPPSPPPLPRPKSGLWLDDEDDNPRIRR